jgi:photosystem II stability/assembly factor-like uncharacterized protein
MKNLQNPLLVCVLLTAFNSVHAQWEMQDSHTTSNLRGIHAVNASVAWASGAEGTILRTQDGGVHWQKCVIPPDGDKLDFRGIWAWDASTALVMSAGSGEQSRLYRTRDGCAHWTEEARNQDKEGFWDALVFQSEDSSKRGRESAGVVVGDPVSGRFFTMTMADAKWSIDTTACLAREGESAFAASNSSVVVFGPGKYILGTGGKGGPRALLSPLLAGKEECVEAAFPMAAGNDSSGVFSLAFRNAKRGVAVGGDYKKPNDSSDTAAWTSDGGRHWAATSTPPHGYRSTVEWYAPAKAWIAAGTNGSDISIDDGRTWRVLDSEGWNALSLPYVVGPKGRMGKLRPGAIKQKSQLKNNVGPTPPRRFLRSVWPPVGRTDGEDNGMCKKFEVLSILTGLVPVIRNSRLTGDRSHYSRT